MESHICAVRLSNTNDMRENYLFGQEIQWKWNFSVEKICCQNAALKNSSVCNIFQSGDRHPRNEWDALQWKNVRMIFFRFYFWTKSKIVTSLSFACTCTLYGAKMHIFFFVALITENRYVKWCFHHSLIQKRNKYLHKSEYNYFKLVSHKSDGALKRLINRFKNIIFLWNCAKLCDLQKPNKPIRNNIHIQHPKTTSERLENIRQQIFMKCDRLPASLFDWHQKQLKRYNIQTTKWSKTLWNIPHWHWWTILRTKMEICTFPYLLLSTPYEKVKPQKRKTTDFCGLRFSEREL